MAAAILTSPWQPGLTLHHLAVAAGCQVTQAIGVAPACDSEPGWPTYHDP